jgi:hypothetical protein
VPRTTMGFESARAPDAVRGLGAEEWVFVAIE